MLRVRNIPCHATRWDGKTNRMLKMLRNYVSIVLRDIHIHVTHSNLVYKSLASDIKVNGRFRTVQWPVFLYWYQSTCSYVGCVHPLRTKVLVGVAAAVPRGPFIWRLRDPPTHLPMTHDFSKRPEPGYPWLLWIERLGSSSSTTVTLCTAFFIHSL